MWKPPVFEIGPDRDDVGQYVAGTAAQGPDELANLAQTGRSRCPQLHRTAPWPAHLGPEHYERSPRGAEDTTTADIQTL